MGPLHGDRAAAPRARRLETAPRCELDLFRRIFAGGNACPERIELDTRVRGPHERDERREIAKPVWLGVYLHRRVAAPCDEEGSRDTRVRAGIPLRVDPL